MEETIDYTVLAHPKKYRDKILKTTASTPETGKRNHGHDRLIHTKGSPGK